MDFNISSKQVGITANRTRSRVTMVLPGDLSAHPVVRHIDPVNLAKLIERLSKARDWLLHQEETKCF